MSLFLQVVRWKLFVPPDQGEKGLFLSILERFWSSLPCQSTSQPLLSTRKYEAWSSPRGRRSRLLSRFHPSQILVLRGPRCSSRYLWRSLLHKKEVRDPRKCHKEAHCLHRSATRGFYKIFEEPRRYLLFLETISYAKKELRRWRSLGITTVLIYATFFHPFSSLSTPLRIDGTRILSILIAAVSLFPSFTSIPIITRASGECGVHLFIFSSFTTSPALVVKVFMRAFDFSSSLSSTTAHISSAYWRKFVSFAISCTIGNVHKLSSSGEAGHPCFSPHSLIHLHVPFWPPGIPPTMAVAGASV